MSDLYQADIAGLRMRLLLRKDRFENGCGNYLYYGGADANLDVAAAETLATLTARIEALEGEKARLLEALLPFAKAGELFPPRGPESYDECIYRPAAGEEYYLSGDDLRRAAALLSEGREAGK